LIEAPRPSAESGLFELAGGRTTKTCTSAWAGCQTTTAADPLRDDLREALTNIKADKAN